MKSERFDFEYGELYITVEVTEEQDPYGTGDSPTFIYVSILSVITEQGLDYTCSRELEEAIEDEAVNIYLYG